MSDKDGNGDNEYADGLLERILDRDNMSMTRDINPLIASYGVIHLKPIHPRLPHSAVCFP